MDLRTETFRTAALAGEATLRVGEDNQVERSGTTFGGKIVEWFRGLFNQGDVAREHDLAKGKFVEAVRREYGEAAASLAQDTVAGSRSLSSRVVMQVLDDLGKQREDLVAMHNLRAPVVVVAKMLRQEGGIEKMLEKAPQRFEERFGFEMPMPEDPQNSLVEGVLDSGAKTPGGLFSGKGIERDPSEALAKKTFVEVLRHGFPNGSGTSPATLVSQIPDNAERRQVVANWVEAGQAALARFPEDAVAIRQQITALFTELTQIDPDDATFFSAAAQSRLIEPETIREHNLSQTVATFRELLASQVFETAEGVHQGVRAAYENAAGRFEEQFGIKPPPWREEIAERIEARLEQIHVGSVSETSLFRPESVKAAQWNREFESILLEAKWAGGPGTFPREEMESLVGNESPNRQQTINQLAVAADRLDFSIKKENGDTSDLREAFRAFFQLAAGAEKPVELDVFHTNGVKGGLIPASDPQVGKVFEMKGDSLAGGNPVLALRNYCAAEKCRLLGGEAEEGKTAMLKAKEVIDRFVETNGGKKVEFDPVNDREDLGKLRESLVEGEKALGMEETSEKFRAFISRLYLDSLAAFGVDPGSQSMVLFGSGSRNEMFPYSDLEFAVLVDEGFDAAPLKKALQLFEMRITALGETPLGLEEHIPIREGFCFDPGGNAPGVMTVGNLVGTPEKVLGGLEKADIILKEVLSAVSLVVGPENDKRTLDYVARVDEIFSAPTSQGRTVGQDYAIENLKDQLSALAGRSSPITTGQLEAGSSIDAKKLSRFPVFLASVLTKFHGISVEHASTADRLAELEKIGVLSKEEHAALTEAFQEFGELRLLAESHFHGQTHAIRFGGVSDEKACAVDPQRERRVAEIVGKLHPIYEKAVRFAEDQGSVFAKT